MSRPKKKPSVSEILELMSTLTPEEKAELRQHLDAEAEVTWSNVKSQTAAVRKVFYKEEQSKAGLRVKEAFEKLQQQGIMDEHGNVIKPGLPDDMKPGSEYDVGG